MAWLLATMTRCAGRKACSRLRTLVYERDVSMSCTMRRDIVSVLRTASPTTVALFSTTAASTDRPPASSASAPVLTRAGIVDGFAVGVYSKIVLAPAVLLETASRLFPASCSYAISRWSDRAGTGIHSERQLLLRLVAASYRVSAGLHTAGRTGSREQFEAVLLRRTHRWTCAVC